MTSLLLVDDDAALRETFAEALELSGFSVSQADNGATALAMAEGGEFDVVVTDLFMPGVDGIEFLVGMQRAAVSTPVIVMTGGFSQAGPDDRVTKSCLAAARALGAVRTLQKPILPSALIKEIATLAMSKSLSLT